MHIPLKAYRVLYDKLIKKFTKDELTDEERKRYAICAPYNVWWAVDNEGESKFKKVFGQDRHELYWYGKLSSDEEKKPHVSLKVETLIKALEYLGLRIPSDLKGADISLPKMKAEALFQLFLEKYYPKFLEEKSSKNTSATKSMADVVSSKTEIVAIKRLINEFYGSISQGEYKDAWDLLAPSYQKRKWREDFERFEIGYTNTVSIYNIHVFNITNKVDDLSCKVYYEDEIMTHTSYDLTRLNKITISQIDDFVKQIKHLQDVAVTKGWKEFERIELYKFFEPAVSEYIWYKCGIEPEQIEELLDRDENITVSRLCRVSCTSIDGNWLIKGIEPLRNYAIR